MNEHDIREEFHQVIKAQDQAEVPPDPPVELDDADVPDPPDPA